MYQALYRKWRPRTFEDVVGQGHITETLRRQVASGRLSHAYLFTGTRGTGKTTCAKILARAVNCEHPVNGDPCNACPACLGIESGSILDVLELDAASNNGVDQVRALRDEAVYTPATVKKRVYIVDEVHMLSTAAFNALLKILEEPPEHLLFILATTELNKVPATIRSRCQQFAFKRILPGEIAGRLKYVSEQEGLGLTQEGAELLARLADGALRDGLSMLDQCANPSGVIGEKEILSALGLAGNLETASLMERVARRETGRALEELGRLYGAGKDVGALLGEMASLTRDLLIRKTAGQGGAGLLTGGYDETTLRHLGEELDTVRLTQMLTRLQAARAELPRSADRRTDAELCLMALCDERLDESLEGLRARIARLEEAGSLGVGQKAEKEDKKEPGGFPAPQPVSQEPQPVSQEPEPAPPGEVREKPQEAVRADPVQTDEKASAPAEEKPPVEEQAAVSGGTWGDVWPELSRRLHGKVPALAYPFLSNPARVQGRAGRGIFTLYVDSDLTRELVQAEEIRAAVSQEAAAMLGGEWQVLIKVGSAPPVSPIVDEPKEERDSLDELLDLGRKLDILDE